MLRSTVLQLKRRAAHVRYFQPTHKYLTTAPHRKSWISNKASLILGFSGLTLGVYIATKINKSPYASVLAVENGTEDSTKKKWKLYQYATCPFCCKVRAFLDYYDVDYETVEVNPLFRKEIKFSEYRKTPILKSEDNQLNDSSLIISVLKTHMLTDTDISKVLTYYPNIAENTGDGKKKKFDYQNVYNVMYGVGLDKEGHDNVREEAKWRRWIDETFVHTLSPNIYRTMSEAMQAMEYITRVGNFTSFQETLIYYSGAVAMYIIGKRLKHRHHLKNDVRESLYAEAHRWVKAVGKNRPFHGGNEPNLADLSMYGVISAIEGLDAFNDLMVNTKIEPWYKRMKKKVKAKEGIQQLQMQKINLSRTVK